VTLAGTDILTGKMSGCWLVIFDYRGVRSAGHIGTDTDPDTPNSIQAKNAWRNAVNNGQITPVAAFKPTALPKGILDRQHQGLFYYGAFEPNGNVYTVVLDCLSHQPTAYNMGLTPANTLPHPGLHRIAHVFPMGTSPDVPEF
jgi:hypothetical protein